LIIFNELKRISDRPLGVHNQGLHRRLSISTLLSAAPNIRWTSASGKQPNIQLSDKIGLPPD